jgi:hypothetical protein
MVLKSLKKAKKLDPSNPKMHLLSTKFLLSIPSLTLNPVVDSVLKEEIADLFGGKDLSSLNKEFADQNSKSIPHLVAGTEKLIYYSFLFIINFTTLLLASFSY